MTETNELQPVPEVEAQTVEVQTATAPETETQAEETTQPVGETEGETTLVEEASAEETPVGGVPQEDATAAPLYETKEQVVERLEAIREENTGGDKSELELLKQVFYKLHKATQLAARTAFIEAGGKAEEWRADIDIAEENFKVAMAAIRQRRAELAEAVERQKIENLEKKLGIIERIKELTTTPEEANQHFDEFKQLQAAWKEVGVVPAERATETWKNYQLYVEQFYDLLKLNSEAREYDFKKNLTAKERLIELAEKLADEEDVIVAFNKLQGLHAEYKEIGPVAKELRDEVWNRFKAASTIINKRHQEHFEAIKAREEENLRKKEELCEKAEAIEVDDLTNFAQWDERTKEVLALQAEWKTIGFASHKQNAAVFERFRMACDRFFTAKAEYYRTVKGEQNENLEQKRKLVEEAEALQDSTEWRKTGDRLIQLQKEWRTIGAVPRKYSEQLWKRFTAACDHFFEAKNEATAGQREEEQANMAAKQEIIEQLKALAADAANATIDKVKELQAQWNGVGHVPFREKDRLYKEYRAVADELYKQFGATQTRRRLEGFQKSIRQAVAKGENTLSRERERLLRLFETRKTEIQTYENNLNFLNATSKSGNTLVAEMNRKVEKLREELELLQSKIKAVEVEMRAPKQEAAEEAAPADGE